MTTISINPSKASSFEFEVSIQGVSQDDPPSVRFVIEDVYGDCDVAISCSRVKGNKWAVEIPKELSLTEDEYKFKLEVVVNEYYFEPADGKLVIIKDPDVQFEESVKPSVTTSFITEDVNEDLQIIEDDVPVEDLPVTESVEEAPLIIPEPESSPVQQHPKKKGSLFDKGSDGKPKIKGIDPLDVIIDRQRKDEKVKEILKGSKKAD